MCLLELACCPAATDDLDSKRYECWARSQVKYVLGDGTGSSFVTGSGNNPPTHSHHRGSSCPVNGTCGFDVFNDPSPNPNTLFGALVGGELRSCAVLLALKHRDIVQVPLGVCQGQER